VGPTSPAAAALVTEGATWGFFFSLGPCAGLYRCNIPRFYQILGEILFCFVLLEMFENSQGFKTF
jgi:hypothetical protein